MHDFTEEEIKSIEETFRLQGKYLRHVAKNLAIWAAEESGHIDWALATKAKAKGHRKTAADDSQKHQWRPFGVGWRCSQCLREARSIAQRRRADA